MKQDIGRVWKAVCQCLNPRSEFFGMGVMEILEGKTNTPAVDPFVTTSFQADPEEQQEDEKIDLQELFELPPKLHILNYSPTQNTISYNHMIKECRAEPLTFLSMEELELLEAKIIEEFDLRRKALHRVSRSNSYFSAADRETGLIRAKLKTAKLLRDIAERKNQLTAKRDLILPDTIEPPKKGHMYNAMRRIRNG